MRLLFDARNRCTHTTLDLARPTHALSIYSHFASQLVPNLADSRSLSTLQGHILYASLVTKSVPIWLKSGSCRICDLGRYTKASDNSNDEMPTVLDPI